MDTNRTNEEQLMHTDFMDWDGLCETVEDKLGWMAPTRKTMRNWGKTAVRETKPVLRDHMPRAHRMTGERKNLYRKRDCHEFAEALLREAETNLRPPLRRRAAR